MTYFEEAPKPKILLVNFSKDAANLFRNSGYNVDSAFIGELHVRTVEPLSYRTDYYNMPHPPYEYDIFIIQTDLPEEAKKYKVIDSSKISLNEDLVSLITKTRRNSATICFMGEATKFHNLTIAGLPEITVNKADSRDSNLELQEERVFAIKELHELLSNYKNHVKKIHQYITNEEENLRTIDAYRIHVFTNKARQIIGEYGSIYIGNGKKGCIPKYLLLPEFDDNVKIALGILSKFSELRDDLFSKSGVDSWINNSEFTFDEIKILNEEISKKEKEIVQYKLNKEKDIEKISSDFSFIKQMLISDDERFEGDNKLTNCIAKVFSFLGFNVEIREQVLVEGKKREDLYISDIDGFKSLCEVKGTIKQNPPESYYSQLLKHLRKSNDPNLNGLLVVNYDYKTHPYKRIKIYKDSEELFSDDSEGVGVLSTVDLYRLTIDVKNGLLSKDEARKIIKKSNRIEYPTKKQK